MKIEEAFKLGLLQNKKFESITEEEFKNLDNIYFVNLSGQNLIKIPKWLNDLNRLKHLYLSNNKLKNIDNLTNVNLTNLDLGSNMFTHIGLNFNIFKNLEFLDLDKNKITKIENLNNLTKLEILNLKDNEIKKIENIDYLIKLKKLYLQQNELTKIENLDNLTQLQILDLSRNSISKIENLDNNKNLYSLEINNNPLKYSRYSSDFFYGKEVIMDKHYFIMIAELLINIWKNIKKN